MLTLKIVKVLVFMLNCLIGNILIIKDFVRLSKTLFNKAISLFIDGLNLDKKR